MWDLGKRAARPLRAILLRGTAGPLDNSTTRKIGTIVRRLVDVLIPVGLVVCAVVLLVFWP